MDCYDYTYGNSECRRCLDDYCDRDNDNLMQKELDSPMPWIGVYIAAASLVCSLAMVADLFRGFRSKRLWFPCKYFSLNATSLTLLAVTLKLPVDLTESMRGGVDQLARVSSLVLMSTAMANFMTSLGSMDDKEILLNLAALGILVITVISNVCIHLHGMHNFVDGQAMSGEEGVAASFMFLSLVIFSSLSLTVLTARRYIECKYQEMHKIALDKENLQDSNLPVEKLRQVVRKYWLMAVTGNPQFVIARSVTCIASGLMSVLSALILVEAYIRMLTMYHRGGEMRDNGLLNSAYKWSTIYILAIQSIGVAVGTIAPAFRWFTAACFKCSEIGRKSFKEEFKVETYWTQRLLDWRESSLPLQVQHGKWKKLLHAIRRLVLNCCLGVQILIVWTTKLVLLILAIHFYPIHKLLIFFRKAYNITGGSESGADEQLDLTRYVLLLPGEPRIPKGTLKNIWNQVEMVTQRGRIQLPMNLIELLRESNNFNGVREFDNNQVPSLHTQEPPNIWSLPVVTLTCIAVSLPNISNESANQLVRCVGEGLSLLKIIEKSLDRSGALVNILKASDVVWVGVELYRKWLDEDLCRNNVRVRTSRGTLEKFSNFAEQTVKLFLGKVDDFLMDNPLNWPVKIIASNSMYRISRSIFLAWEDEKTDEQLFKHLSLMIADILAACLTNLPQVLTMQCYQNSLMKRENSVHKAALLLGKTEEILEILQQREKPSFDIDKAACIEEWRTFLKQESGNQLASISSLGRASEQSNGEHVAIALHS